MEAPKLGGLMYFYKGRKVAYPESPNTKTATNEHIAILLNNKTKKLLSHRMRGYNKIEHSICAFSRINKYPVKYFEVDTRVSSDGEIFIYHDSEFVDAHGISHSLSTMTGNEVRGLRYSNGEPIALLRDALLYFKELSVEGQRFCIDIKDYGFEQHHLDLVRDIGIEHQVIFVSWMPQSLFMLNRLGCTCPLILSHWNLLRFGLLGGLVSRMLAKLVLHTSNYVLIGRDRINTPLGKLSIGYQHALITTILNKDLLDVLAKNGGGVCVHTSVVSNEIITYCKNSNLSLWVFSAEDTRSFLIYAENPGIDVVFCDNAPLVSCELQ